MTYPSLRIPEQIYQKLEEDPGMMASTLSALEAMTPWMSENRLTFFPEYTDHGVRHVEEVLASADALVSRPSWEVFSPGDAAVLVLATALHDAAMHLSEEGFCTLLDEPSTLPKMHELGDLPWRVLWDDFLAAARRFDGRKLIALFGDASPIRSPAVRTPRELTYRDRILIGEFLRRNHHRLAHQIALSGIPGADGFVPVLRDASPFLADLAGLVARSHGMPIRGVMEYLRRRYDEREYRQIHPVFLMVLLRVSDYMQIQRDRARPELLRVRRLKSPFSQGEWEAHDAIDDLRNTHADPEALFVQASPKSIRTYLRVKEWLTGLQWELDTCWAVLGEIYGRYSGLNELGITLRRIRSNLDHEDELTWLTYYPLQVAFEAANADLLKLLIKPLYGDHPEMGVRELLQNSLDAVRELENFRNAVPAVAASPERKVSVSLTFENDELWFEIRDTGIGMTAEIVRDYFLKAGASFRRSEWWRKHFEDESGHSRVIRSGRFGVGALAAFLLGDQIEVSTRHVTAEDDWGVAFTATLESESIELRRVAMPGPCGTRIRVRITSEAAARLKDAPPQWDWYCLSDPVVERVNTDGQPLPQRRMLPASGSTLPPGWFRIQPDGFDEVHWTYGQDSIPYLSCNGIVIDAQPHGHVPVVKTLEDNRFHRVAVPKVSVFDPDGNLPLNLARTALLDARFPFQKDLCASVVRQQVVHTILHAPSTPILADDRQEYFSRGQYYAGIEHPTDTAAWFSVWMSLRAGTTYFHQWHIGKLGIRRAVILPFIVEMPFRIPDVDFSRCDAFVTMSMQNSRRGRRMSALVSIGAGVRKPYFAAGIRVAFSRTLRDSIYTGPLSGEQRRMWREVWSNDRWIVLEIGKIPDPIIPFQTLLSNLEAETPPVLGELYFGEQPEVPRDSVFCQVWEKYVDDPLFPYDPHARAQKYRPVLDALRAE